MGKPSFLIFAIIFLYPFSLFGQKTTKIERIPFELTEHNNIVISGILNDADTVKLMFHTAASSLSMIKEFTKTASNIIWDQKTEVNSWGGTSDSRYSKSNSLKIGELAWNDLEIWESENSGPGTVGKFGPNLFADRVIEIDFDNQLMTIRSTLPELISLYDKLPLFYQNDMMFIEGKSAIGDSSVGNRFLIHSGFGGTLLFDDAFVNNYNLTEQLNITGSRRLKDSYGNVIITQKALLSKFSVGAAEITSLPVEFFEGSIGRQKMSVLGGNILKRFNLIIDADRAYIYLKASKLSDLPF